MSCSYVKGGWEVRWRDAAGCQRSRRFEHERAAREFDQALHGRRRRVTRPAQSSSPGVYPYNTAAGIRWRYLLRASDGMQTTKRGFRSEQAAREAREHALRQLPSRRPTPHDQPQPIQTGDSSETFGEYWERWLSRRKVYLETGTWEAYERDGRLRLLPALAPVPLAVLELERLRALLDDWLRTGQTGQLAPKTINNTLGTLTVCLNDAVADGLIAANPALRVRRLPAQHIEREYLRLHEIALYLDSCTDAYRPLAEALVGAGLRISEALALKVRDLELEPTGGIIVVQRSRKQRAVGSTKPDRSRSVEIGKRLAAVLGDHLARHGEMSRRAQDDAHVFVTPQRTHKREPGRWQDAGRPIDRNTVSRSWHKAALREAGLRDMPLHALRHTAAAAWLAAGNSLMYVQRQLGHADIATTERYYGHLERHVLAAGAIATEEAIERASRVHATEIRVS